MTPLTTRQAHLLNVLCDHNGSRSAAAKALRMSKTTLLRDLKEIQKAGYRLPKSPKNVSAERVYLPTKAEIAAGAEAIRRKHLEEIAKRRDV